MDQGDSGVASLRVALRPFLVRHDFLALAVFAMDFCFVCGMALLALITKSIYLKITFAALAGGATASLFVLGHDAVHGCLTTSKQLNALIARLSFLPSLHNATLWFIQHNRIHHHIPNVRGCNSWSPLTHAEFLSLPKWRRILERYYRSGIGAGTYYLAERWWKHKFFPSRGCDADLRTAAFVDFLLLVSWITLWLALLYIASRYAGHDTPLVDLAWGFLVPFLIWNQIMGLTVLLQHTHPGVRWYLSAENAGSPSAQVVRTVSIGCPRWYGLISHEILEHPVHHINPSIPFYNLHAAQTTLAEFFPRIMTSDKRPLRLIIDVVTRCKLYDYENHRWTDFRGQVTSLAKVGFPERSL